MAYLALALSALAGGLLQAVTGFGGGIMTMLALPIFFSIADSAAIAGAVSLSVTALLTYKFRKSIDLRLCLVPTACFILFSVLAIELVGYLNVELLALIFGIFLMLLSAYYFLFGRWHPHRMGAFAGVLFSSVSGLCSGLFSIGGPLMSTYFLSVSESKDSYIGNTQFLFFVTGVAGLGARISSGIYTARLVPYTLVGLAAISAGMFAGLRILGRLDADRVKLIAYALVGVSGALKVLECL